MIRKKIINNIKALAIKAYKTLCCEGMARVDLFLKDDNEIIINEINTIPGFTSASMFPMMWQKMGIDYKELISEIIQLCLRRFEISKSYETDYNVAN